MSIYSLSLKDFMSDTKLVKRQCATWESSAKERRHVLFNAGSDKRFPVASSWLAIAGTQAAPFAFCVSGWWERKSRRHSIQRVLYYAHLQGDICLRKQKKGIGLYCFFHLHYLLLPSIAEVQTLSSTCH